jgi:anti-sigma regulatory factor (Ser/Thr protein kinase)
MAHALLQQYQPGVEAPDAARHDVAAYLIEVGHSEISPVAELLTSELVTSSLVHSKAAVTLRATWKGERLHVEVTDQGGARPMPWDPDMPGRGLRTVSVLAEDWGVRRLDDDGRASWFDLDGT